MPTPGKRPLSLTIVALLFLVTGIGGTVLHLTEIRALHPFPADAVLAALVSVVAIICGIYLLLRQNWARWLAIAWLLFHVAISALHSRQGLLFHTALLVVFSYLLFRAASSAYFRRTEPDGLGS
jgi:hypothetical protein